MKNFTLLLLFTLLAIAAQSQTIKGKVVDPADDKPLAGATLTLTHVKDSLRKYNSITDATGVFQFTGLPKDSFFLKITFTTYEDFKQIVALNDSTPTLDLATVYVPKKTTEMSGVVVTAKVPPVQQKGDTSQYNASQFKVNPDATTEDLIRKMPGITVDTKTGTVTAQGQTVQKVTVDGRDFFGDDATATLRNLPAEIVDKIQVFDRMSDQAQFTGFDDGNSQRSINIVTRSGVTNGQFGRIYGGYGTDDRYAAGGNVSFFKGNRRISLVGNFNNINQQNFASQDILGAMTGGGGGRGGGGGNFGGGGGNFGGGGGNFNVGQASGISKTNGFGINFGDKWGKKLDIQGSYFFNSSNNTNDQETNRQTIFSNGIQKSSQTSLSGTKNQNHRVNMRLTYTIDSNNSIIIMPNISFQNTKSATNSFNRTFFTPDGTTDLDSSNYSDVFNRSNRDGFNIRNNILWRHSFSKRGRTLSVSFNTALNKNNSESYPEGYYRFYDRNTGDFLRDSTQNQFTDNVTDGYTLSGNISYTEPLTQKTQLQVSYQPSFQKNKANQQAFDYDEINKDYSVFKPSLANKFDNTTITHNGGVTLRLGASRDAQLSIGADIRYTELNSDRIFPTVTAVRQSFLNVLPNVMWRKKVSAKSSFQIFYRANTNMPSVTQLQDVLNLTNPTNVSIGNPNLKQSFTNVFTGRYTFTNTQKGQSFFANLSLQSVSNYISNVTYRISDTTINGEKLQPGSNLSVPVNINGYKSFGSFFTFSQPVKFIKSNISLSTGFNYSNLPGLVEGLSKTLQKTKTENYSYNGGIVVASNINEYIDFNLSYNAVFSNAKSSITTTDNKSVTKSAAIQVNLLTKKGWFLQNDVTNQSLSGLSDGFNQSYWLWNAALGKKFLKKKQAELKISVFDLLKQNQAISRSIAENVITDSRSVVLQQYFMLTFTYSLRSFGTPARQTGNQRGNWNGPQGGGFPGGGGGFPGGGGGRPNF